MQLKTDIEHIVVEIIPTRKTQQSLCLANLYSPPLEQLHQYDHFVHELRQMVNSNEQVLFGDFNAPHVAWGYQCTIKKRARLHDAARQHGLMLMNDLLDPTRVSNSVSRDTNPDLMFARDVQNATWTRLPDTLGSDHHIIHIEVEQAHHSFKTGKARLTYWTANKNYLDGGSTTQDIEA
ncbi:hypothetical protein HPB51_006076 [Rhipicephalus microplus]|uniref:Endonuclease/exonuclease/phosphatase domain-containing protein n=1 Tax=Rhipicephalus microplus TaxID=6941 RepID=A0A9J6ERQ8_RHIMP|nr:hypothetical protein HPB51_006076 [Rhipicephalus microplus]